MKTIILIAALASSTASAEPPEAPFVEVNAMPFIFHGWSAFAGYSYHHLQFGAGLYAFKLPDFVRDAGFDGASGLDVHSELGAGIFGRYFASARGVGFYGAVQLGGERFGFQMDGIAGKSLAYETYVDPYVGYLWKPWHKGFFINPNFGVAFSTTTSGTFTVNSQSYHFKGYVPLAFFQIGYAFE